MNEQCKLWLNRIDNCYYLGMIDSLTMINLTCTMLNQDK